MHHYKVTAVKLVLPSGMRVYLSPEQAALREHALIAHKKGFYEVLHPVQFKRGEILAFDEPPSKLLLYCMQTLEKVRPLKPTVDV